jgi:hypothetical protein
LPPEFATRYRQQYVDRLWMRGLGAVVGLYVIGVAIFLIVLRVYSFQDDHVKGQVAALANTYTNVLRTREQGDVLQEQLNLKYAALDCWKIISEQLPADFSLVSLTFSPRGVQIYGTAPPDQQQKVIEYNDAIRHAAVSGEVLFREVTPPTMNSRGGSTVLNWNFECQLNLLSTPR